MFVVSGVINGMQIDQLDKLGSYHNDDDTKPLHGDNIPSDNFASEFG